MAIAALVLGIISIVFGFIPYGVSTIGLICGIVGIVMGVLGRREYGRENLALAGLICSIIGVVLSLLVFAVCGGCALCAACVGVR